MKKGRHRRFEEARKLKQQGPEAFLPGERTPSVANGDDGASDEFSDLAAKYGAFDDDEDDDTDDE